MPTRVSVSLYRQYRPQTFAEVVGQDAAIDVLSHALSSGRIGHAYLFSGSRGCGKTSVARILAKALNCTGRSVEAPALNNDNNVNPCGKCPNCLAITAGESLDVVEIDGASNNSVDEVRELKSHVTLAPFSSKYKAYIIDEVHMLSTAAFNALLKTLEEPPSYVVFILATTEPHKVPVTIRSRCQHIPFHSISAHKILEQLTRVCEWEKVSAQPEALWEVARQADGAMRDALSMLEQVINRASIPDSGGVGGTSPTLNLSDVEATLGAGSRPALERWVATLHDEGSGAYTGLKEMFEGGSSQRVFEELFSLIRNLWLTSRWPNVVDSLDVSEQEKKFLQEEAPRWKPDRLRSLLTVLVDLIAQARQGVRADVLIGLLLLALDRPEPQPSLSAPLQERLPSSRAETFVPGERNAPRRRQKTETPPPDPASLISVVGETPRPQSSPLPALNWQSLPEETAARLLAQAQEINFTLYCGLLDTAFLEAEGNLLLDVESRYCYEVLCLDRNCARLVQALPGYAGIFLRHGTDTFACPPAREETSASAPAGSPPGVKDESPTTGLRPRAAREERPRPSVPDLPPPADGGSGEEAPEPPQTGAGLPFAGLMKDISRVMRGEVVLVRHKDEGTGDGGEDEPPEGSDEGSEN